MIKQELKDLKEIKLNGSKKAPALLKNTGVTPKTMKAAVITAPGTITAADVPVPEYSPDEVRVRMEGCGVCASSIPVWEGRPWFEYPFEPGKPGHEGWGRVESVGENVDGIKEGNRIAFISDHAFAEYDIVHKDGIVVIPDSLDDIPLPGEPLGCAMNIFKRSNIKPGQTVAIIGIGFLGALLTNLAWNAGAYVIAISRRHYALDIARQYGAIESILMEEKWKIVEWINTLTSNEGCDVVIEATGKQLPLDIAGDIIKVRGQLVIAGYHQDGLRQVNMQQWNWRGIDVINAHERDPKIYSEGIRDAVKALENGTLDPSPLYTHYYSIETLNDAFVNMIARPHGFMKALVKL